jgi:5-methylcytosine-specific restriction endonuclease McrA
MTRFYSTRNWQLIAKAQLARAPVCQGCEEAPAAMVDHITPIKQGGAMCERANLQSLCVACHNAKTGAEKVGKRWTPPKHRGCDELGVPLDPRHAWRMGDESPQAGL